MNQNIIIYTTIIRQRNCNNIIGGGKKGGQAGIGNGSMKGDNKKGFNTKKKKEAMSC